MNESFKEYQDEQNARYYEQWLKCGFTGEPHKNEYGWITGVLRLFYPTTEIEVFKKMPCWAGIEYAQLPNGKWVAASDLNCATHGYGSAASIWDTQYDTKEEAVTAELNKIEGALYKNDQKPFVVKGIEKCRREFKKVAKSVFEIDPEFYYGKTFEQTALF